MIRSFHIKNFRSCRDVVLDGMGPIIALAGRNGAGKTNILEGISWIAKAATADSSRPIFEFPGLNESVQAEISFNVLEQSFKYLVFWHATYSNQLTKIVVTLRESLFAVNGTDEQQIIGRDGESAWIGSPDSRIKVGESTAVMPAMLALLPGSAPFRREIDAAISFLSAIRYYSLDEPSRISGYQPPFVSDSEFTRWLSNLKSGQPVGDSVLMRLLHLHKAYPEKLLELRDALGDSGLGIISDLTVAAFPGTTTTSGVGSGPISPAEDKKEDYYYFTFRPSDSPHHLDYSRLSVGTRRVLRIILSVIMDESAVMLMEQPEDSIHSGLMKKVIAFLRQNSATTQIILASHSANVFNKMLPNEIRLVAMKDGFTLVRALSQAELAAAEKYVQEDGPLSDYLELVASD